MRQLFFTILSCTVIFTQSLAQSGKTVAFKVLDVSTAKPILTAKIQPVTREGAFSTPDSTGLIIMELSLGSIFVSSYEYNSRYVEFDLDTVKTVFIIYLEPSITLLEQAVVSAGRQEQPLKKTSSSIEMIQPSLIENRNSLTIKDGLSQVPGLFITDNQLNIRNGSGWSYGAGSRVMVLVDDMPMLSGDAVTPLWSFINTEGIESIEIIKGASSVLYGSSALTGVVNIKSEKPGIRPKTVAGGFYGVYNKPQNIEWEWNDKPLTISGFNASHLRRIGKFSFTMNINGQIDEGYRMGDQDNRLRFGTTVSRRFFNDRSVMGVRFNYMQGQSASFLLWQNYDSAYTALNEQITTTNATRQAYDYYWKHYGKKGFKAIFQARQLMINNDVDNGNANNDQSNSSNTHYFELRLSKKWTRLNFHSGYLLNVTNSESPLFAGKHRSVNQAPYLQFELHPTSRMTIELGARYETYKLDKKLAERPVFRSGFNLQAAKFTYLRASFGQGFRFPTIAESFIQTTVGTTSIYPNPDLRAETGWNAEIGLKQGLRRKNLKVVADIAGFWMEYQNMMEFIFTHWSTNTTIENGLGYGFKSLNVGDTRITGIDLSVLFEQKMKNDQLLEGIIGYTYSVPVALSPKSVFAKNAFDKDLSYHNTSSDPEKNILKYRNKHLFKFGARYESGIFDAGVNVRYNSFIENIDGAFVAFPFDLIVKGVAEAREKDKRGKTFVDIRAGITLKEQFRFGISANNIFRQVQMNRPADITGPGSVVLQFRAKF